MCLDAHYSLVVKYNSKDSPENKKYLKFLDIPAITVVVVCFTTWGQQKLLWCWC